MNYNQITIEETISPAQFPKPIFLYSHHMVANDKSNPAPEDDNDSSARPISSVVGLPTPLSPPYHHRRHS